MANQLLTNSDLKGLLKRAGSNKAVVSLWTQETQSLNLFQKLSKDEQKIKRLADHLINLPNLFKEVFSETIEKIIEPDFVAVEPKIIPGNTLETIVNPEEKFVFAYKNEDNSFSGYYSFTKELFFKVYDQLFGGKRVFVKKGELSAFESESLVKIITGFHQKIVSSLSAIQINNIELKGMSADIQKISKDLANSSLIQITYDINHENNKLGAFDLFLPYEILKSFSDDSGATNNQDLVHDDTFERAVKHCVQDVQVHVRVELGIAYAPLKDVLNVKTEDNWDLNISETGHLMDVAGQPFSLTSMGEANGYRAVQITEMIGE